MTSNVSLREENKKKERHSQFLDAWRNMLEWQGDPLNKTQKRRATKSPYNLAHKKMRRKMARRSRRINRHKKGKRKQLV